jgi:hypothetical protein
MLFKALIERLLGSDEAQDWKERERAKTSRFSYDNYPNLVKILVELLEPSGDLKIMETPENGSSPMDLHGAEGVFPALQILRQARPPGDLTKIRGLVRDLLPSPHWHMRDMAARTYVSLSVTNESYHELSPILDTVTSDHNGQHGRLLVVKYLLKRTLRDENQCSKWSQKQNLSGHLLTSDSFAILFNIDAAARTTCNELVRLEQLPFCTSRLPRRREPMRHGHAAKSECCLDTECVD